MKKINVDILILTSVMCLVPILFGLYFYQSLPDIVAVHFDINNNPNGVMPKEFLVFGLPVLMMIIQIFVCVAIDIKNKDIEKNKKSMFLYKLMIPVVSILLYVVIIMYAVTDGVNIVKIAMAIVGVMFIVTGIDLPKTTRDSHINFPDIKDDKIYTKTKKVFGIVFIIDGILALISCLVEARLIVGIIGLLILEAIVLFVFAFYCNRKFDEKQKNNNSKDNL